MPKTSSSILYPGRNELPNHEEAYLEYRYAQQVENNAPMAMNNYHWHRYYELLFISKGHYKLLNNRKIIESDRPGIFLHMPYSLHNLNSFGSDYHRKVIYVTRDVVNRFTIHTDDFELLAGSNLIYAWPNNKEWKELDAYASFANLHKSDPTTLAMLYSLIIRRTIQIAAGGRGEIVNCPFSYIQNVLNLISDHLSEKLTVESVSSHFNTGRSKFQSDFSSVTGISFHRYLITLRLNRAYEMITAGKSIMETALETGYSSEAHFIKAFREYWDITPGQLQKP